MPIHEFLSRWTSREISEICVYRGWLHEQEQDALEESKKPKEQTPDDMLSILNSLGGGRRG